MPQQLSPPGSFNVHHHDRYAITCKSNTKYAHAKFNANSFFISVARRAIANPHNPTHLLLPTKKHSRLVCVADNLLVCQQRTNLACTCDCNESTLPFQCRILRPWIMSTFTPDGGLFKINHIPMQSMKTTALPQLRNCSNAQNQVQQFQTS